jgi:hypothetical protein
MASSPQLPLTSNLTVNSTPTKEELPITGKQILKMRLAAAKSNARFEREERLRIRRARTVQRKEIVVLKAGKRELYGQRHVKDTELKGERRQNRA